VPADLDLHWLQTGQNMYIWSKWLTNEFFNVCVTNVDLKWSKWLTNEFFNVCATNVDLKWSKWLTNKFAISLKPVS
jgi:hypothetical protein